MTTIAGADPADLRIGMPLRAEPVEIADGVTAFVFSRPRPGRRRADCAIDHALAW